MALIINTNLTTQDGGSVPAGSLVKLETFFPMQGMNYNTNMKVWRDEQTYINGFSSFKPIEIPNLNFSTELTLEEYTGITPTVVQNKAMASLEQFVGEGNVDINWNF